MLKIMTERGDLLRLTAPGLPEEGVLVEVMSTGRRIQLGIHAPRDVDIEHFREELGEPGQLRAGRINRPANYRPKS